MRLSENIADECWSHASADKKGNVLYYDTPGAGYVRFELSGSNCNKPGISITFRSPDNNPLTVNDILHGGNSGEPFKGPISTYPIDRSGKL